MTALIAFSLDDRAHLATDGAATIGKRLVALASKIHYLPHLNAAVLIRGSIARADRLRYKLSSYASIAAVRECMPGHLRRRYGLIHYLPMCFNWDMLIAGHDGAPFIDLISSFDRPNHPRFTLQSVEGLYASPFAPESIVDPAWRRISEGETSQGVIELLDGQRQFGEIPIGGYGVLSSIGADGFRSELLKTYPDIVGKRIDPTTGTTPRIPRRTLIRSDWR